MWTYTEIARWVASHKRVGEFLEWGDEDIVIDRAYRAIWR